MLSILFWNMGRKQAANALAAQACASRRIGLLIVAECSDLTDLGQRLAGLATPLVRIGRAPSNVTIFSAFARPDARQVHASTHASAVLVSGDAPRPVLVVGVHLRSKLFADPEDQDQCATTIVGEIVALEKRHGIVDTLVIGDFNMDPFERPMVAANRFHAVMDQAIARKGKRTVAGTPHPYFYNPMWGGFGDQTPGPPGTYRRRSGGVVNFMWHTFDQVLLRPGLLDAYNRGSLDVLTSIAGTSLGKAYSDHAPISISLR